MTAPYTADEVRAMLERARRDDWHRTFVGSDLRCILSQLLAHIEPVWHDGLPTVAMVRAHEERGGLWMFRGHRLEVMELRARNGVLELTHALHGWTPPTGGGWEQVQCRPIDHNGAACPMPTTGEEAP